MPELGVNIDHVATVRQARRTYEPDPVWAAALAELGGADCITLHLREDRRHIQDRDLRILRQTVTVKLNLEMACDPGVIEDRLRGRSRIRSTLVPERREEVTTEGGLDIAGQRQTAADVVRQLADAGISVSLFLDPDPRQIEVAAAWRPTPSSCTPANTPWPGAAAEQAAELEKLTAGRAADPSGRHGPARRPRPDVSQRQPVATIEDMHELNIGHSIVARAVMVGFEQAVREMKRLVER